MDAKKLEELNFDNTAIKELDQLFYSWVNPTPITEPIFVAFNPDAAKLLDLDPQEVDNKSFIEYLSGNELLPGSQPIAFKYAGHQFGQWVPHLGDGRAILLGEIRNSAGEKWDLQLKGSGKTPYSRMGDGRAVLRSTIREYLCSEAMHALDIPTTRALSIVGSTVPVYREYIETAAVMSRLAPSHIRFGSFEFYAYQRRAELVQRLADYTIKHHFSHITAQDEAKYLQFFKDVINSTAMLIAKWQAYGFCHGVMNTDNMSILGLTIDYGPFGFMEQFDPYWICNHSDDEGRYSYRNQPAMAKWNLERFMNAISPLIELEAGQKALNEYDLLFKKYYHQIMMKKLGIDATEIHDKDQKLVSSVLDLLEQNKVDYTNFFRNLAKVHESKENEGDMIAKFRETKNKFEEWLNQYKSRIVEEIELKKIDLPQIIKNMHSVNPKYIFRNYLAETAIKLAKEGDYFEVIKLWKILRNPFDEQPAFEKYTQEAPDWARNIQVTCSS